MSKKAISIASSIVENELNIESVGRVDKQSVWLFFYFSIFLFFLLSSNLGKMLELHIFDHEVFPLLFFPSSLFLLL